MTVYIARRVGLGCIVQSMEFEANNDHEAWTEANDGVDPLLGHWVEVQRKPDPQQCLVLE